MTHIEHSASCAKCYAVHVPPDPELCPACRGEPEPHIIAQLEREREVLQSKLDWYIAFVKRFAGPATEATVNRDWEQAWLLEPPARAQGYDEEEEADL